MNRHDDTLALTNNRPSIIFKVLNRTVIALGKTDSLEDLWIVDGGSLRVLFAFLDSKLVSVAIEVLGSQIAQVADLETLVPLGLLNGSSHDVLLEG
jgi:hypothetical protein